MRNKRNIVILTVLMTALVLSPVFSSADEVEKINLNNFEETILITDMDITRGKKSVAILETELKDVKEDQNKRGDTDLDTKLNVEYNVRMAEKDLAYEEWLLAKTKENVISTGKSNYFNYLLKEDEIALAEAKIVRLKNELGQIQTKISLGTEVQSTKVAKELEITKEEFAITSLEYEMEALALELNRSLLWDLETTIDVFDLNIPTSSFEVEGFEALIEEAIDNHGEMVKLREELALAKLYYDILVELDDYEEDDEIMVNAQKDIDNLKLDVTDKKFSLEYDIRSGYHALLNAEDQLTIKQLEVENLEYMYEITKKRFDVGLEVRSTLDSEKENIDYGYHALEQAKLSYYLEVEAFKDLVGVE